MMSVRFLHSNSFSNIWDGPWAICNYFDWARWTALRDYYEVQKVLSAFDNAWRVEDRFHEKLAQKLRKSSCTRYLRVSIVWSSNRSRTNTHSRYNQIHPRPLSHCDIRHWAWSCDFSPNTHHCSPINIHDTRKKKNYYSYMYKCKCIVIHTHYSTLRTSIEGTVSKQGKLYTRLSRNLIFLT